MKLVALMPCRNEDWVIGLSLRVVLKWANEAVVLLHSCTDDSKKIVSDIANENPSRVHVLENSDLVWREMEQRQQMLDYARSIGSTHIAITDADEVLTGNLLGSTAEQIKSLPSGGLMQTRMLCAWRSLTDYRSGNSVWSNRYDLALAFHDNPNIRWSAKNDGYDHHQRNPLGSRPAFQYSGLGGVIHLQFANWDRLVAKHALYKMSERVKFQSKNIESIDRLYNLALDENGLQTTKMQDEIWGPYSDLLKYIDMDKTPWQIAECERLMKEHGKGTFEGLNLFGVV